MDILPDVALLEIFDFYVDEAWVEAWYTLVHVCRKWRNVVFGSPRRLHLRLHCTARTPVREMLDVWPLLPIVIRASGREMYGDDNIIAALEHTDRVCGIGIFSVSSSRLETLLAAMRRPFPALAGLRLRSDSEAAPAVIPASFLGGSAPRLQILILDRIPFPGLSKLLSSATHLVDLSLWRIPHSGYIPPESMAACLSVLTRLESLVIRFESPQSRPVQKGRLPPSPTRILLPVLIELQFFGVSEYLEVLVARIDAPILDKLDITFFQQLIFDTPQLTQFISHTPSSRHKIKRAWSFPRRTFRSDFHRHSTDCSSWQSRADSHIGSFRLWRRSATPPSLTRSFSWWTSSTSLRMHHRDYVGKTTLRAANGWNFYIHFPL